MSETKKRILFLCSQPFFQRRGSPIRVGFNLMALAESGYDVDLLTLPMGEDREIPGVTIIRIPNLIGCKTISIGPSIPKLIYDVIMLFTALKMIKKTRYDVIHGIEDAGAVGVLVAKRAGVPLVFEKHSDPGSYKKGGLKNLIMNAYAKVEAFTIKRSKAVIGTGPGLVRQATDISPIVSAHHIMDIPSSLVEADQSKRDGIRAALTSSDDDVLLLYVGSFASYQGIDLLFDSIPQVVKECPQARFIIYGGSQQEIEQRRAQMAAAGAEGNVVFAGFISPDELPDTLAAMDGLLSPRVAGANTPLKLLDYLKAGQLIIASDTEANRLILNEEICLFGQADPGSYAKEICKAVKDPELRTQLAGKGRALIDDTYNYTEFKRRLAACYTEILS